MSCLENLALMTILVSCTAEASWSRRVEEKQETRDRAALLAFKAAISQDPYDALVSWNDESALHHCRWRGVSCRRRRSKRVTGLALESWELQGSISPSIANLSFLRTVHLPYNQLHGAMPSEIGRLRRLQYLNLSFNALEGAIPSALVRCRKIRSIDLTSNRLRGHLLPELFGSLPGLTELVLASNHLTGAIPAVGFENLTALSELDLSANELAGGVPPPLCGLSSLTYLDLSANSLEGGIPHCLGNISGLLLLDLSSNELIDGQVPPSLGGLSSLIYLDLSANELVGAIPSSLGNLSSLVLLDLSSNHLSEAIPTELSELAALQYLNLSVNGISGGIPPGLTHVNTLTQLHLWQNLLGGAIPPLANLSSSLRSLDLSDNRLEGCLPDDLGHLQQLEFLRLYQNRLSCTIPTSLFNLTSLAVLLLFANQFSGTLPPDLGDHLPSLRILQLSGNRLGGRIPITLSNASRLEQIDLGSNRFHGRVPARLGNLPRLSWFSVQNNSLKASDDDGGWSFFASLANCTKLEILALSDNDLRGKLPGAIANFSAQLKRITMGRNQISGGIPRGIENLKSLTMLAVEDNLLNGSLTDTIGELGNLHAIALQGNRMPGRIPDSLGNLSLLNELYLDGNRLSGSIPSSLGNCRNLLALDLSSNRLSGPIPAGILSIPSLSSFLDLSGNRLEGPLPLHAGLNFGELDVSSNELSGSIPSALGDCLSLEYLYLQDNSFQGSIPSSLANLKGIRSLDLSLNNLSGRFPGFLSSIHAVGYLNLSFNHLSGEVPKDGVFANATIISLSGNSDLCGGVAELELPPCAADRASPSKRKRPLSLGRNKVLVIPAACFLCSSLLLAFAFVAHRLRRRHSKKKKQPPPFMPCEEHNARVSYALLMKATDGFSPTNLIGAGSFGAVYRGILDDGETVVAVKVLNLRTPRAAESFMAECEATRNIRHRNLVKILTSCSSVDFGGNEFKALVYEFMPNGSLEKWLHPEEEDQPSMSSRRSLTMMERISIAVDVASAMDYLHNQCETPITHCDLKPSNVLLDIGMTAHVADFGLAKFLSPIDDESSSSADGPPISSTLKGSIGYVAPEYGVGGQISTEGDVYSFGIVLLELFTATRPTHDMFKDGLTLRKFVQEFFAESRAMDIVDPSLLAQLEEESTIGGTQDGNDTKERMERCLNAAMEIGLSCTTESPKERTDMARVVRRLMDARDGLVGAPAQRYA